MKKSTTLIFLILMLLIFFAYITGCKKTENPIKFTQGTIPDSVYNLAGLNSQFDDYNSYVLGGTFPIIFSSNRASNGGQFDLVLGDIWFKFDQTTGAFSLGSEMLNDPFYGAVINKANTTGNDFGPYSLFSSGDGYEYLLLASQNAGGLLDLYYLKYVPRFGSNIPYVTGPNPVKLLNSSYDDAYISFDSNQDSAYFTSNRGGNFDIYLHTRPFSKTMDSWLDQDFAASTLVDSINSGYDDKCPFVYKNVMLFTSNRPGGMGGFDLYISIFNNGNWGAPINLGPKINTASDEYRPILFYHPDFKNMIIIFSSNRPGGLGGYDLYFTGIPIAK